MVRTQIQLPTEVHQRLKSLAEQREWSLAETIRRAAEEFLDRHPGSESMAVDWNLPEPRDLGTRRMSAQQLKRLAQTPAVEERVLRERGDWPFNDR